MNARLPRPVYLSIYFFRRQLHFENDSLRQNPFGIAHADRFSIGITYLSRHVYLSPFPSRGDTKHSNPFSKFDQRGYGMDTVRADMEKSTHRGGIDCERRRYGRGDDDGLAILGLRKAPARA